MMKNEQMLDIKIIARIIRIGERVRGERVEIATAAPVRAFPIVYNIRKENPATIVFIAPSKIRN